MLRESGLADADQRRQLLRRAGPSGDQLYRTLKGFVSAGGAVRLSSTSVRSGRDRIVVSDRSRTGNFHLAGRGVNKRTGMRFMGPTTWRVRLAHGTYSYGSDRQGRLKKRLRVR